MPRLGGLAGLTGAMSEKSLVALCFSPEKALKRKFSGETRFNKRKHGWEISLNKRRRHS